MYQLADSACSLEWRLSLEDFLNIENKMLILGIVGEVQPQKSFCLIVVRFCIDTMSVIMLKCAQKATGIAEGA